jgi:glycosyltransferase involved in cell wall biosynthesis
VRDFIRHSAYRDAFSVVGPPVSAPFEECAYVSVSPGRLGSSASFAHAARAMRPDLTIVQQHVPTGVAAALWGASPVVLHRHFRHRRRHSSLGRRLDRWRYGVFARTLWVSDWIREPFAMRHPSLAVRALTLSNGLDPTLWRPAATRESCVTFVGRADPEKGVLQAAAGVASALADRPHWRARFLLSRASANAATVGAARELLAPLRDRATIALDQPHSQVRAAFESAAVALVPSRYDEAFGRTAIEAFAGGAALIASRYGALPQVVGDAGLLLPAVETDAVAKAVASLIDEPERRAALARRGRERLEAEFDIRRLAQRLDAIIAELAA